MWNGEDYITRSFMICTFTKCFWGDHKKEEMDGACSTYGEEERCIQGFYGET
jgi:hypothetical protein